MSRWKKGFILSLIVALALPGSFNVLSCNGHFRRLEGIFERNKFLTDIFVP